MLGYKRALQAIKALTADDLEAIEDIEVMTIGEVEMLVDSKTKYSTVAGIDEQIANFPDAFGWVYIWQKFDGKYRFVTYIIQKDRDDL